MAWRSVAEATRFWLENRLREDMEDQLDEAEAFILSNPPQSIDEAVAALEIIRSYGGDGRCDGLDVQSLGSICAFMRKAA